MDNAMPRVANEGVDGGICLQRPGQRGEERRLPVENAHCEEFGTTLVDVQPVDSPHFAGGDRWNEWLVVTDWSDEVDDCWLGG